MKILVCIAQVPDTTSKIAFTDNNTAFATEGLTMIINPYDEWYALVRALELKEAGKATAVHLITVGKSEVEPVIRKALAVGANDAIRFKIAIHYLYHAPRRRGEILPGSARSGIEKEIRRRFGLRRQWQ